MATTVMVHELAAELGMSNSELMALCGRMGIGVKTHLSVLVPQQADRIRSRAEREGLTHGGLSVGPLPAQVAAVDQSEVLVTGSSFSSASQSLDTFGIEVVLRAVVRDFGRIWLDPRRLRAILSDFVPNRRAATLLLAAAEEGLVSELSSLHSAVDDRVLNRLTAVLVDRRAIDSTWAHWAIAAWSTAVSSHPQVPEDSVVRSESIPPSPPIAPNPGQLSNASVRPTQPGLPSVSAASNRPTGPATTATHTSVAQFAKSINRPISVVLDTARWVWPAAEWSADSMLNAERRTLLLMACGRRFPQVSGGAETPTTTGGTGARLPRWALRAIFRQGARGSGLQSQRYGRGSGPR